MNIRNNQSGMGVVEMLLILVAFGILGFTGWFVWQSQQATSNTLNETLNTNKTSITAHSQVMSGDVDNTLFFKYPNDWTISQTPKPTYRFADSNNPELANETTQVTVLTSPDGKTQIKIEGGIGGVGGACIREEVGNIAQITSLQLENDHSNAYAAYRSTDGTISMGLVVANDLQKTKVGSTVCNLAFSSLLPDYLKGTGLVTLTNKDFLVKPYGGYKADAESFTAYLQSASYKDAVDIIQSIHR